MIHTRPLVFICIFRAAVEDEHASVLANNVSNYNLDLSHMRTKYVAIYAAVVVCTFLLGFASAGFFFYTTLCSSQNLHNLMFERLLGATIYFFDHNPVGTCAWFSCYVKTKITF